MIVGRWLDKLVDTWLLGHSMLSIDTLGHNFVRTLVDIGQMLVELVGVHFEPD